MSGGPRKRKASLLPKSKQGPPPHRRCSARLAGKTPTPTSKHLSVSTGEEIESEVTKLPFTMELAEPPPTSFAAGVALQDSLRVNFKTTPPEDDVSGDEGFIDDLSGLWALVSLVSEDRETSLAPPRTDLLLGKTADSVHYQSPPGGKKNKAIAYTEFSSLKITEPGKYCFKINVIDMNRTFMDEAAATARVLPALYSEAFEVVSNEASSAKKKEEEEARSRRSFHNSHTSDHE